MNVIFFPVGMSLPIAFVWVISVGRVDASLAAWSAAPLSALLPPPPPPSSLPQAATVSRSATSPASTANLSRQRNGVTRPGVVDIPLPLSLYVWVPVFGRRRPGAVSLRP